MASRILFPAVMASLAVSGCVPAQPLPGAPVTAELAGRSAGQAQRCVPIERSEALRYGGERLVIYGRGRTVWVNRLGQDCAGIRPTDVLIIKPVGSRFCRGDLLESRDPVSGTPGPGCRLGDFVPYRR